MPSGKTGATGLTVRRPVARGPDSGPAHVVNQPLEAMCNALEMWQRLRIVIHRDRGVQVIQQQQPGVRYLGKNPVIQTPW